MRETSERQKRDQRLWLIVFLLLATYMLLYSGQLHSADEESILSMAESLSKVGWFDTPHRAFEVQVGLPITQGFEGVDGRLYSKKGWAWPVFLTPFYAVSLLSSKLGGLQTAHLATLVVTALTGALVYLAGRELGFSPRTSLWGALIFGLGTIALVYAKFLFAEPFVGLALTGSVSVALRCRHRQLDSWWWAMLGGLLFGLASAARIATLILGPVFVAYLLWPLPPQGTAPPGSRDRRRRMWSSALAFGLGVSIPILFSGIYNWITLGNPLQSVYESDIGFTTPVWEGLYGLLISPGKGFFWFSPVLLLALPGSLMLWRRSRADVLLVWGLVAATVLLYSMWYMWWGGTVWGPRFLVPVAAPLALLLLPILEKAERHRGWALLIGLLFCASVAVQLLGSAVNFLHYGASLAAIDPHAEWTLAIYDVRYQPIWGHLQLLQLEHLDFSWIGRIGSQLAVDWLSLSAYGGAVIACVAALCLAPKHSKSKWVLPSLAMLCLTVMAFGQLRLHNALAASPGARQWQMLYEQVGAAAKPGDVIFVQDALGAEMGFWFDRSPTRRYSWSPRPIPLDQRSEKWMSRSMSERVWLASGQPAAVDPNRGIERWLLQSGAKLLDKQFDEGARLGLFERTPPSLVEKTANLTFADQVHLLRYAYPENPVAPGQAIHLVLTWQAAMRPDFDYSVFVHLVGANGQIVRQIDGSPVGGMHPMGTWREGELVTDRYGFLLSDDFSAGDYQLLVGVYRWDTLERLPIADVHGNSVGDVVNLGKIRVGVAHSRTTTNNAISSDCSASPMNCRTLPRIASRMASAGIPALCRATSNSRGSR